MAKRLCCSAFGKIYYAKVNDRGIITEQKNDLTEDAVVAVMDKLSLLDKGWVFRTREEAEDALPAVAKEIGVEYEI